MSGTAGAAAAAVIAHRIEARIDPDRGWIEAIDRLAIPAADEALHFSLHQGLEARVSTGQARLEARGGAGHLRFYRLRPTGQPDAALELTLAYSGRIRHALETASAGMGREQSESIGSIDSEQVFLSGYTGWYPRFAGHFDRFDLRVDLPAGWLAVSQGAGPGSEPHGAGARLRWRESQPQDEIYLLAGRYQLYRQPTPVAEAQVYLRAADPGLAQRYLDATALYLRRYSELLGPYPYAKFALVENIWNSGYGMPSFTLLGAQVLRLPFILDSSYPHEILHNWWGNGVFIDPEQGNWSEGLTAYLADYLNRELAGGGANYRRAQLEAYQDYVHAGVDLPLGAFRARQGSASQAIGYGKSLMLFHMLRGMLGDAEFIAGLRRFYAEHRFQAAGYTQLRQAFEASGGIDLGAFFAHWVERGGAPRLRLADVSATPRPDGQVLVRGRVEQVQAEPPFPLEAPLQFDFRDREPLRYAMSFRGQRQRPFQLTLPAMPLRVALDPEFDVFRYLEPGESPPRLSQLFGASGGLIVLPSAAPAALRAAYRSLAERWTRDQPDWRLVEDDALENLPEAGPIWLLGWENRWLAEFAASAAFELDRDSRRLSLNGTWFEDPIPVLTRQIGERIVGWAASANPRSLAGLARKLPHYGQYGFLLFAGDEPVNQVKGQWPIRDTPLMHWFSPDRPLLRAPQRPLPIPASG